jgi:hypothetical protein
VTAAEYNQRQAADAIAALDHLYRAWRGRLTSRELQAIVTVTAALERAAAEVAAGIPG